MREVFFVGAGASKADGALLQNEIFRDYFRAALWPPEDALNRGLRRFFRDFWGLDVAAAPEADAYPTFEEALGILELAVSRGESFAGYPLLPEQPSLQQAREALVFLIARALRAKLTDGDSNHDRLVRRLNQAGRLKDTAFISLNYDILLDNAVIRQGRNFDLDYGVEFTNYAQAGDWHRPDPERAVPLLKLHGSLNWLYCPTCITLTLTPEDKRVASLVENPQTCAACASRMTPIIVPPTYLKATANIYLQSIWQRAERLLLEAERIVFCGYSLPDADLNIKYLLKRMELLRAKPPEMIVVNHHAGKDCRACDTERTRYSRFLKSPVTYTEFCFEDLCQGRTELV